MLDRYQLEAFAAVVEHQSFERAASVLTVTRGAISQRIKSLEEALSTVLVNRVRPIAPTAAGEIVLRHVKAIRLLEHDVYRLIAPKLTDHDRAPVAIAVNADSLATWFGPSSQLMLKRLPVALEVLVEDQDHTWPMLARGDVVGCISTESRPSQGFDSLRLGAMEYRCVASPAFAATYFPDGLQLRQAIAAPAIVFNRKDLLHDRFLEALFGVRIERYAKHYFPSPVALLEAILADNGYGLVPSGQVGALLEAGTLVDLAPSHPVHVSLYWHHWQHEPEVARTVTEFVVEVAKRLLLQEAQGDGAASAPASPRDNRQGAAV